MRPTVRTLILLACLALSLVRVVYGHNLPDSPIPRTASVFIDTINGFGPELKNALRRNGVPLVIVEDKDNADFEITGAIRDPSEQAQINENLRNSEQLVDSQGARTPLVTLKITNLKTKSIVWGYGATGFPDLPSAAEACAKQLKHEMKRKH